MKREPVDEGVTLENFESRLADPEYRQHIHDIAKGAYTDKFNREKLNLSLTKFILEMLHLRNPENGR